jgi:hypothetical protein
MGGGLGSPLLSALLSGGLGYAIGSNTGQRPTPDQPQPPQQPQPAPAPAPQPTAAPAATATPATESEKLPQLKLLDELHRSGALTDEEFAAEKRKVLCG